MITISPWLLVRRLELFGAVAFDDTAAAATAPFTILADVDASPIWPSVLRLPKKILSNSDTNKLH